MATSRTKGVKKPEDGGQSARDVARPGRSRRGPGEAYFELVRRFPLRPIESDAELERARTILNELLDRDSLDRDRADYLDVLGDLIDKYEEAHHPLPPISEVEMLRHFLDTRRDPLRDRSRHRDRRIVPLLDPRRQATDESRPHRGAGPILQGPAGGIPSIEARELVRRTTPGTVSGTRDLKCQGLMNSAV